MDVILLERIAKLGQMGEVVKVRPGFARNFLLPQKKAVRATEENRKRFEEQRAQLEIANRERRAESEIQAETLRGFSVVLIRQAGESGQLYGSVTARDIAAAVAESGHPVRRQQIQLAHPIKMLGVHRVAVALHPEVTIEVAVNVARSKEEAETQAQIGRAVLGAEAEQAAAELAIEEQARELFEIEVAEQAIEDIRAEAAFEEKRPVAGHKPSREGRQADTE
jgi:large subunit ribosomal protein L9